MEPNPSGEGLGQFTERSDHEGKALVTTPGWFLLLFFCRVRSRVASRGFFLSRPATPGERAYAYALSERRRSGERVPPLSRTVSICKQGCLRRDIGSVAWGVVVVVAQAAARGLKRKNRVGSLLPRVVVRRSSFVVRRRSFSWFAGDGADITPPTDIEFCVFSLSRVKL